MASFDKRNGKWSVRFWFGGRQIRLSGYDRKGDAEKAWREYLINENVANPTTFEEMATRYIVAHKDDLKQSSIYSFNMNMKNHVFPIIGDKQIDKLKVLDFDKVRTHIAHYSPEFKILIWRMLGSVLRYAYSRYNCPALLEYQRIERPQSQRKQKDYWTPNEFRKFITAVKNEYTATNDYVHFKFYVIFNFLYLMGTRAGELVALQWSDVDLDNKTVTISKSCSDRTSKDDREKGIHYQITDTKTHKSRIVDIPSQLLDLLIEYKAHENPQDTDYVFSTTNKRPMCFATLGRTLDYYIDLAGVKRITPHQFRHSNASLVISQGSDNELATVYVLAERLGNSRKMIMEVYGSLFESAKHDIISKIKI